ncbi:bifunctional serine/threonine-protein kinase/formylglycine-generating enzyme family protein [Planktothricoides raciborskii]|uniref:Bifunctional serine/threonine-protein kinase/formylglycine-generating enzyme family protein n=1 Tax=Planktothricoides raciborskii GIHE-MW2 TaxID=2792601 RepID=A0AAU8JDT0_9CYAN
MNQAELLYKMLVGQVIKDLYHLRKVLGAGGFGGVFLADEVVRDRLLRELAIKLIADNTNEQLEELIEATRLDHPNLIRSYAAGDCQLNGIDFLYLVMEKAEYSLEKRLEQGKLSVADTKKLAGDVAAGLVYLHGQNKVHRDLKPGNVLWLNNTWKLSDFGLVRSLGSQSYAQTANPSGTIAYTPPEAFGDRGKISTAWDVWSLGIMVVNAVSGQVPYSFDGKTQLLKQVMTGNLVLPNNIPSELESIVRGCLQEDRRQRWTAERVLEALKPPVIPACAGIHPPVIPAQAGIHPPVIPAQAGIHPPVISPVIPALEILKGREDWKTFSYAVVKLDPQGNISSRNQGSNQGYIELINGVEFPLLRIPSGSFLMGSPHTEAGRTKAESPQHRVSIAEFCLGQTQVTQAQWRVVANLPKIHRDLDPDPSDFKGDNRPVECVTWYDCIEFCARLSQKTGKNYRLPSEAEWEYACRAGTTTPFHFGETISAEVANYDGNHTYGRGQKGVRLGETIPVGSLNAANAWGLHDMHGNVWEWCLDDWHDSYTGAPTDGRPWLDTNDNDSQNIFNLIIFSSIFVKNKNDNDYHFENWQNLLKKFLEHKKNKLLRGGDWNLVPRYCRSAARYCSSPGGRGYLVGFRIAVSLPRT